MPPEASELTSASGEGVSPPHYRPHLLDEMTFSIEENCNDFLTKNNKVKVITMLFSRVKLYNCNLTTSVGIKSGRL